MPLFHPHVIERYLDSIKIPPEHTQILSKWDKYIHNETIKKTKETALYDSFSQGILQRILQYRPALDDPNNYTLEQNQTIGKGEVEYALGHFGSNKGTEIIAPLELKSIKTNLDIIVPSKNKSPVQQAWDYATEVKGTKWVLVSNYLELRLYAIGFGKKDYEVFKLDNLTDPHEYAHFLLLLSANNLLGGFTHALLSESEQKGKEITKKFYAEYKKLREEIITSLHKENKNIQLSEIIRYTQVILDRVLFAAFAEDKGLLPLNTIKETCISHRFNPRPIWENFKGLFNAIDKGNTSLHIPGYNGGLFQYNSKLDTLNVSDDLCLKFKKLSEYDFASDVSVNILGHILEQSIIDLEELQKVNEEDKNISIEKKKSKRKKEGVYYTPSYITQYIVDQTVGGWLNDRKKEIGFDHLPPLTDKDYASIKIKKKGQIIYNENVKKYIKALEDYKNVLSNIKVLDPACGSGAFLIEAYDYLFKEGEVVNNELSKLKGGQLDLFAWSKHILTNNLFGVDINQEAVEITKLSIWLKTANSHEKLTYLDNNIKCGDSLISDRNIANSFAFDWRNEFTDVIKSGGFDVILGNPPYVFSREKILKNIKQYFIKNFISAQYQINTYLLFVEKSLNLLKQDKGKLGFIIPNTWLMIDSAAKLRELILNTCTVNRITNLFGNSFENVNVETIILNLTKMKAIKNHSITVFNKDSNNKFELSNSKMQSSFEKNDHYRFQIFSSSKDFSILEKMKENPQLSELVDIKAGLQAYEVGKGVPKQTKEDVKNRIYDYTYKHDSNTYPYLDGKDVERYFFQWNGAYLKYGNNLAAPRKLSIFEGDVLVLREITGKYPYCLIGTILPANEILLFNRSNIAILNKKNYNIDLKYVLAILCSKLISYYFIHSTPKAVRKMFPKIILSDLRKFPIKIPSSQDYSNIIGLTEKMIAHKKELLILSNKFIKLIHHEFSLTKINTKLVKWYDLSFEDFIAELAKEKISLTIAQKEHWLEYFDDQKEKILSIANVITQLNSNIDQIVYKLYDLTNEEIDLIENYHQ